MKLTTYLIGALYVVLIPSLIVLSMQHVKDKATIANLENKTKRLTRRIEKVRNFKSECPCCFVMPAEQESR